MLIPSTITARRTPEITRPPGTSIPPPISTTSNLWVAQDGTFFNPYNVRQSIRPGGPLYLRLLHLLDAPSSSAVNISCWSICSRSSTLRSIMFRWLSSSLKSMLFGFPS